MIGSSTQTSTPCQHVFLDPGFNPQRLRKKPVRQNLGGGLSPSPPLTLSIPNPSLSSHQLYLWNRSWIHLPGPTSTINTPVTIISHLNSYASWSPSLFSPPHTTPLSRTEVSNCKAHQRLSKQANDFTWHSRMIYRLWERLVWPHLPQPLFSLITLQLHRLSSFSSGHQVCPHFMVLAQLLAQPGSWLLPGHCKLHLPIPLPLTWNLFHKVSHLNAL